MKNFSEFEDKLLDSGQLMKRAGRSVINNMGKLIALLVAIVMIAVTFTDITFEGIFTENFFGSLLLLLTSAYIIYFSLEDAGEKSGEECEEYKEARARYDKAREQIDGDDIEPLRVFCEAYSAREMEFRRRSILLSHGLSPSFLDEYQKGKKFPKKTEKILRRANKIKPTAITPKTLLSRDAKLGRSELEDPEKLKIPRLIIKLIPSTICMSITVSVMLSAKDGMTASDILNGILKLSALPLIGFRGYSAGYSYTKHALSLWSETKANILESYLKEK